MSRRSPTAPDAGFTFVEVAVVVVIIGLLTALGTYSYFSIVNKARNVKAIGDLRAIAIAVDNYWIINQVYPENLAIVDEDGRLDPWGRPYDYLPITEAGGKCRKDKNLHPINTNYDLYSAGADGKTTLPLTAGISRDDVIRANDGGFLGLAENY